MICLYFKDLNIQHSTLNSRVIINITINHIKMYKNIFSAQLKYSDTALMAYRRHDCSLASLTSSRK